MVLKTKSCSLLTTPSRSSPNAAMFTDVFDCVWKRRGCLESAEARLWWTREEQASGLLACWRIPEGADLFGVWRRGGLRQGGEEVAKCRIGVVRNRRDFKRDREGQE